jgi:hypothetical protein
VGSLFALVEGLIGPDWQCGGQGFAASDEAFLRIYVFDQRSRPLSEHFSRFLVVWWTVCGRAADANAQQSGLSGCRPPSVRRYVTFPCAAYTPGRESSEMSTGYRESRPCPECMVTFPLGTGQRQCLHNLGGSSMVRSCRPRWAGVWSVAGEHKLEKSCFVCVPLRVVFRS